MKLLSPLSLMLGIIALPLSGCMMAMHGIEHDSFQQKPQPAKTVEKELTERDVILSLHIPLLSMGEESTFTLRVNRISTGTPVTGAKVAFLFEQIQAGKEHAGHYLKTFTEHKADEIAEEGVYQLKYISEEHGLYRITARVWMGEEVETATPLTIALTQKVTVVQANHRAKNSITPMVVIGGIAMAVMMLIMVL